MGQRNYWNYFAFSQIRLVEGKIVPAMLLPHDANRHSSLAFPKFNNELSIWGQRKKHHWSYFAITLGESDCLHWSNDNDDTLGLVYTLGPETLNQKPKPET